MRIAIALLLAGCFQQPTTDPGPGPGDGGWGTGPGGTGGNSGFGCYSDSDCTGVAVCARDGECLTASAVRTIHVTWTMNGEPATDQTCAAAPDLDISFSDPQSTQFGFSPVPCREGKFTIDKLPNRFDSVQLSRTGDGGTGGQYGTFNADGVAVLDLTY